MFKKIKSKFRKLIFKIRGSLRETAYLQAEIFNSNSLETRIKLWNLMKKTQKSKFSWLFFLKNVCSVSYVVVNPKKTDPLFLENDVNKSIPLYLLLDPGVGLKVLITKQYDQANINFFAAQLKKNKSAKVSIIDIGANIGMFSRQFIGQFKDRLDSIYVYEPDPAIFPILENNLQGIKKVNLFNAGIGDVSGNLDFYIDSDQPSSSSLLQTSLPKKYYNVKKTTVEIFSADNESKKWLQNDGLLFYKSDTQGYDLNIAIALGVEFFLKVHAGIIEIFPYSSDKEISNINIFSAIIDSFPYKAALDNPNKKLTTEETVAKIYSGNGFDLIFWR